MLSPSGMAESGSSYYKHQNLQDLWAYSTNFSKKDVDGVKKINNVKNAERKLTVTTTLNGFKDVSLDTNFIESNEISKFHVTSGEKFTKGKAGVWVNSCGVRWPGRARAPRSPPAPTRLAGVKPFLFLAIRADDGSADAEYEAFLTRTGLSERELVRHRLEAEPLPEIRLEDWSGIMVGGFPFNTTTLQDAKSQVQRRVEAELDVCPTRSRRPRPCSSAW